MQKTVEVVSMFLKLAHLSNGSFNFPEEAVEYAKWTGLRQKLMELTPEQQLMLVHDGFRLHVPGVLNLLHQLEVKVRVDRQYYGKQLA